MKIWLFAICLVLTFACSDKKKSDKASSADIVGVPVGITTESITERSASSPSASQTPMWRYEKSVDREGRPVYKASILSPTRLQFDFPYAGSSTATLTIRKRANDTHIYIQVSNGQFNRSFQGGKARVRFDSDPPASYGFSAAENGSANVIFFDSEQALIRQLKASQKMTVDVEFAGQSKRQIAFRTAGLKWTY